jgi:hypothetical protein
MLNRTNETKTLPSQFVLTPDQRIALLEAKLVRAEQYAKALAELAKKLKQS